MATQELDARRVRAAKNQSLFREVNERIEELATNPSIFEDLRRQERLTLACECAYDECSKQVEMTIADYEKIRADSNKFFVLPGHDITEVEEIVGEGDGFVVVSKLGVGESVAQRLDPRKRKQ
jgi:hypothetical protein